MVDSLFLWIYRVISMTCCNCVSRWYCCVWQDQQFSAIYSFNKAQNVNCMINCWKGKRKQKNIYIRQSVVFKSNFFFFFCRTDICHCNMTYPAHSILCNAYLCPHNKSWTSQNIHSYMPLHTIHISEVGVIA